MEEITFEEPLQDEFVCENDDNSQISNNSSMDNLLTLENNQNTRDSSSSFGSENVYEGEYTENPRSRIKKEPNITQKENLANGDSNISSENEIDNTAITNNSTEILPMVTLEENQNIRDYSSSIVSVSLDEGECSKNSSSMIKREHITQEENWNWSNEDITVENEIDNDVSLTNDSTDTLPLVNIEDEQIIRDNNSSIQSVTLDEGECQEHIRPIIKREHINQEEISSNDDITIENENDNDISITNNYINNLPLVNLEDDQSVRNNSSSIGSVSLDASECPENIRPMIKRERSSQKEKLSNEDIQESKLGIKRIKLEPEDIDIDQDVEHVEDVGPHHSSHENGHNFFRDMKQDIKDFGLNIIPKSENWEFTNETRMEIENVNNIMVNKGLTFSRNKPLKPKTKKDEKNEFARLYDYLFEFKAVYRGSKSTDIIFCKICNFCTRKPSELYNHAGEHMNKLGHTLIPRSKLPVNYDYFVCTICHNRIMSKKDIPTHMKAHKNVPFSSAIVDVKFIQNYQNRNKADILLHCCEVCNLGFIKYMSIVRHLNDHSLDEISAADIYNDYNYTESDDHSHSHFLEGLNDRKDIADSVCHIGGPMRRGTPKLEVEIDNEGKYVPDGWQRKVFQITKGSQKGNYKVWFISPFGYFFYDRQHVQKHLDSLESKGISQCVNVELMDFTTESHKLPANQYKRKKKRGKAGRTSEEVECDNTNVYIPEGWQRKLNLITSGPTKGKHFLRYVSPYNANVYSRGNAKKYIENLKGQGFHLSVDVDKLDFSLPSALVKERPDRITKVEVELDNSGKYIPEGWQRKMFKILQGYDKGVHKVGYISPLGNLLYCRTVVIKHLERLEAAGFSTDVNYDDMDFVTPPSYLSYHKKKGSKGKRKGVTPPRKREEVEVDNTDVYVPDGWKRIVFKYMNGPSRGQYFVYYKSPFDKEVHSKTKMEDYLKSLEKNDCHLSVDIEKLDFSIPPEYNKNKIKSLDDNKVYVEVDNTGIYIPEGWERKVIQTTFNPGTISYKVHYITPKGKILYHRANAVEYIKKCEDEGISLSVDVDELDFKPSSNNLYNIVNDKRKEKNLCRRQREEVKVDNTDIYIPEGWERRAFIYTDGPSKGNYFIRYISLDDGKEIFSRKHMMKYLESLEIDNCSFSVDIERLNFSVTSIVGVSPSQLKIKSENDSKIINKE